MRRLGTLAVRLASPFSSSGSSCAPPRRPGHRRCASRTAERRDPLPPRRRGTEPSGERDSRGARFSRWQSDEEMTLDLLELLAREGATQAREIAAIEGFYDAKVEVTIDREASPYVVTVRVDPGAPVRVSNVRVDVTGPAVGDVPLGSSAIAEARSGWTLRLGEVFRQREWIDAKDTAVRTLRRSPYAAARIARSEARVEPVRREADLAIEIESGPRFSIGALEVRGLTRYPASLVENFSILKRGEPYTEAAMDAFVRRLAASGYFASVQATIDPETANPEDATVRVSAVEAPTHRFEGAISYSTDTEFGARASYTNVNLDDRALQMRIDGRFEVRQELLKVAFTWPPTASKWLDTLSVGRTARTSRTTRSRRRGSSCSAGAWTSARIPCIARRCSTTSRFRSAHSRPNRTQRISRPATC